MKIQKAFPVPLFQNFKPDEPKHPPHRFDVSGITETIQRALAAAGLNTQSGPMKGVTDTIHQALSAAGLTQRSVTPGEQHGVTIDGTSREVDPPYSDIDGTQAEPASRVDELLPGAFLNRSFTNNAGTRNYMLYVPASYATESCEPGVCRIARGGDPIGDVTRIRRRMFGPLQRAGSTLDFLAAFVLVEGGSPETAAHEN